MSDPAAADTAVETPSDFDDAMYLRLNPDVAGAVAGGVYPSGLEHYLSYGAREGRRYRPPPGQTLDPVVVEVDAARPRAAGPPPMPAYGVDPVRISPGGGVSLTGWIDDATDPLAELLLEGEGWAFDLAAVSLARTRRRDVEAALHSGQPHAYGFWGFVHVGRALPRPAPCRLRIRLRSGATATLEVGVRATGDLDLRDSVLAGLIESDWFGGAHLGAVAGLGGGAGAHLVAHNRTMTAGIVASPYVERFGSTHARTKASIVVCLYGRPEYLAVQNALFAGGAGMDDCELIYVCNSPDLAERLLRDARIANLVHGLRQTLVLLPGNAGFGAANNLAAGLAASDRIIACNPDVVPCHADWARRHAEVVETLPPERTTLFGVPLYYETGALMHGGMYFEIDTSVMARPAGLVAAETVRVQHYGKGAPPETAEFLRPRPVPAITGAFISCRRDWFERLGGFSEDFVFGHYEDADLCLRSIDAGVAPWLHDIRMYHLEGSGGTRGVAQEGALLVNRWLFATRWAARLRAGLLGPRPTHKLLAEAAAESARPARKRR